MSSEVRVIIAGAAGRMGQALVRCSLRNEYLVLVGAIEHSEHESLGVDAGVMVGDAEVGVPLSDSLEACLDEADVVVDFTHHSVVPHNVKLAAKHSRAVVIGTTALTDDEAAEVAAAASIVPIVWAPNMSLGVNLLFAMTQRAAATLGDEYGISISDVHHVHKLDAPSGTALRLGEKAAEGRQIPFRDVYVHDEGGQLADDPNQLIIRSFRQGEVVGDHTVAFDSAVERVELTHHAKSRDCFAVGALHAASWVVKQRPRLYDMQDVLGLKNI